MFVTVHKTARCRFLSQNRRIHSAHSHRILYDIYIYIYIYRFQNVFLRCPTPRLHCFLSCHWPSFRFLSFMAFFIPSIQFFFGFPRALFCFVIHFNAIWSRLPSAIPWTWPYHVSWFCSISFINASSNPIYCLIFTFLTFFTIHFNIILSPEQLNFLYFLPNTESNIFTGKQYDLQIWHSYQTTRSHISKDSTLIVTAKMTKIWRSKRSGTQNSKFTLHLPSPLRCCSSVISTFCIGDDEVKDVSTWHKEEWWRH